MLSRYEMANQNSSAGRRDPLVVFFSNPDHARPDADATPGELISGNPIADIDAVLRDHIAGECNDAVAPRPETLHPFNDFRPPRLQFVAVSDSLPGYSSTSGSFPSFTLSIPLSDTERESLAMILGGEGARVSESRRQALHTRLGNAIRPETVRLRDRMMEEGLFSESFTICYALRFADGSTLFHSDPIPIIPNEGAWSLELRRCVITSEGATMTLSLLRRPCRLLARIIDCGDLRTSAAGGIIGIDLFTTPDHASFPVSTDGVLSHLSSFGLTTASRLTDGVPSLIGEEPLAPADPSSFGWIFNDSGRPARSSSLADPTGFRLMTHIPILKLDTAGGWILIRCERDMTRLSPTEIKPDYFHRRSGEGRLIYSTVTQHLLADPRFRCPEPYAPFPFAASDDSSSGTVPLRLTVALRLDGRLHLLSRLLEEEERGCWLTSGGTLPSLHSLFHPMTECEFIALETDSEGNGSFSRVLLLPMQKRSIGGVSWTRLDEALPLFTPGSLDDRYPDAIRGSLTEWRRSSDGELLCSSDTNPVHYPSEGRFRASAYPLTGGVDFSGRKSGVDLPLLLFTAEGIRLCGREEVKCDGRVLRLWRAGEYLSTFTALSPRLICSTREGGAFMTGYGIYLQTQTTTRRLSARGLRFASSGILLYHPEVSLLEFRLPSPASETEGGVCVSWWYDLELDVELELLTKLSPASSLSPETSAEDSFSLTTRPFRLPATPSGVRLILEDGVGTPPQGIAGATLRMEATADLRIWSPVGARRGLEIESLIPFPGTPVWYRLRVALPSSSPLPIGFIIDF